jgi:hypothetical protein
MNEYEDEILVECKLLFNFETVDKEESEDVLNMLLPAVVEKMYIGDVDSVDAVIASRSIRMDLESRKYLIDIAVHRKLEHTAMRMEEEMYIQGNATNPRLAHLIKTHNPVRGKFLPNDTILITCQKKDILIDSSNIVGYK